MENFQSKLWLQGSEEGNNAQPKKTYTGAHKFNCSRADYVTKSWIIIITIDIIITIITQTQRARTLCARSVCRKRQPRTIIQLMHKIVILILY